MDIITSRLLKPRLRLTRFGLVAALFGLAFGCAHRETLPGTTVPATAENRKILETIEEYRLRLMERNIEGLLVLASDKYFEDSGTPRADDDYGYKGLKGVLTGKLSRVRSLRYHIEYRNVTVRGDKAEVEVFLNGAFELLSETGEKYRRVNDFHRFVLERTKTNKWKFISGM